MNDNISQELFIMTPIQSLSNNNVYIDMKIPFQVDLCKSIELTKDNIAYLIETYPKLLSPAYLYPMKNPITKFCTFLLYLR